MFLLFLVFFALRLLTVVQRALLLLIILFFELIWGGQCWHSWVIYFSVSSDWWKHELLFHLIQELLFCSLLWITSLLVIFTLCFEWLWQCGVVPWMVRWELFAARLFWLWRLEQLNCLHFIFEVIFFFSRFRWDQYAWPRWEQAMFVLDLLWQL